MFSFFFFIFFSSTKLESRKVEQILCVGAGTMGGEVVGRGRRMNIVWILCTHVCKCKNTAVETVLGIRGGGMKESDGGGEF
jgi:hypothetical protein